MITRDEALDRILTAPKQSVIETVALQSCVGRVLAKPVLAGLTHPPTNMSSMDGYAARHSDCQSGAPLKVIGEAAAGHPFEGSIGEGECVRVFTGSVVPNGADHVVIQEDVERQGDLIEISETQPVARNIRPAGVDFKAGDVLISSDVQLLPRQLSICAAGNHAELSVRRQPRVALLANGDELKLPGATLAPGEIIASNEFSLTALIESWGGKVINLGIAPDDPQAIRDRIETAEIVDIYVPVGGASVGDHDHMKSVFSDLGFSPVFSKVAVKPGKPTWFSQCDEQLVLGLPGNPASALVCAHLFLKPLIHSVLGIEPSQTSLTARLSAGISANGRRESFLRGHLSHSEQGELVVKAATNQDSSLLSPFVTSNVLIHRPVDAPALEAGDKVSCISLD